MGRRPIEFGEKEWDQISKLCALHCTGEEIAGIMGCSLDTLETKILDAHGVRFSEFFREKAASGKMSLRRKQYEAAMGGNPTLLIWLGKQWLKQTDKMEQTFSTKEDEKLIIQLIKD